MRTTLLVAAIVSALLLPVEPAAAGGRKAASVAGSAIVGFGLLSDGSILVLRAFDLIVTGGEGNPVEVNRGTLALDGVSEACTVQAVVDCTSADLLCASTGRHTVVAASQEPLGFSGSLDGIAVVAGNITVKCVGAPPTSSR